MKLVYDVEAKPKTGKLLVFAMQQLLAVLAATIAVPTIIGLPMQIPAAILGAGLGTLTYLLFTRFKSPVVISSSFAFLSALGVATAFGYLGIIVGGLLAGLVYVVIAIVIHFVGTKWVSKLMPPVIIGPTVALIGLSLAGAAMGDIVKANADSVNGSYNLIGLLCGLVAFFVIVICSCQKKYKSMRLIPFIIGIGAGYAVAAIFTGIGMAAKVEYLKVIDWSPLVTNFVADGKFTGVVAFLDYPDFALIEAIKELVTGEAGISGATMLNGAGVLEVAIAFIPVALVVFAEHIADHKNLGSIIGRDLVEGEPGLEKTLLGDGVGSMVGTVFGVCPNTTYGESVGCVAITRNASVRTIFVAALMCIVLSFLSPIMALLKTIPSCVMGGVCLTLYGFIAVSGLKMFKEVDLGNNRNLFTVSAILIAGIGGLAIKIPYQINAESTYATAIDNLGNEFFLGKKAADGTVSTALASVQGAVSKAITVTSIATALILGIVTYAVAGIVEKKTAAYDDETDAPEGLIAGAVAPDSSFELKGAATEKDTDTTENA